MVSVSLCPQSHLAVPKGAHSAFELFAKSACDIQQTTLAEILPFKELMHGHNKAALASADLQQRHQLVCDLTSASLVRKSCGQ